MSPTAETPERLPVHWRWGTLGETGRYVNGVAFKPVDWVKEGMPIIRIQNLTDPDKALNRTKRQVDPIYHIDTGDLLVSWSATLDAFLWDREPALLNQHIFKVVPNECIAGRRFLYYLLKQAIAEMLKTEHLHGSTMKHINRGPFLAHRIPLPPLDEQRRIVAEIEKQFTRLDAGVTALRRVQANLKRYRASVLKSACEGRLVPTEADLARAQGRTFESGAELLTRILTERRAKWSGRGKYEEPVEPEPGGLAQLPSGWRWSSAAQLCGFITKGTTPNASKMFGDSGDVPFIKVYNLTAHGQLDLSVKPTFVSWETHRGELARSRVTRGDILINIVGPPLGQAGVVPDTIAEANINQAIARLRPVTEGVRGYLAICVMTEWIMRWAFSRAKTTAGQTNLTLELCRDLPIPLPPLAEQLRIVTEVDRRLSVLDELEALVSANLQRATRLRQSILQRAFAGELVRGP
ncbi:MAG: restriction endonuclease subunit S [Planctomycetota bacterium]